MSDRQTYAFPLAVGVDAEINITSTEGVVTHEHLATLYRYLAIYYEALGGGAPPTLGGEHADARKLPFLACGKHRINSKAHRGECLVPVANIVVPPEQERPPAHIEPNGAHEDDSARAPYVDAAGVLQVDPEHEDVIFDNIQASYTVYFHEQSVCRHVYVTGSNVHLELGPIATCTACGKIIIIKESELAGVPA